MAKKTPDERTETWKSQRKERGFDDRELYSLDNTISKFILPRLKAFRENTYGYPMDLTSEEWEKIIDEMIFFHQYYGEEQYKNKEFDWDRLKIAGELFAKYYGHLWQ